MKIAARRGLIGGLGLLLLWLPMLSWAHDFHTSITDARYNPKTKQYELAIRVFADDLEEALSRQAKSVVRLDRSPRVNGLIAAYVQAHVSIAATKGAPAKQKFLGLQEEADAVWLYVEIPASQAPAGQVWVENTLLTELFTDQMNILNLEVAGKKKSVLTKTGDTVQAVPL